jgi:hypothetical protein
MHHDKSSSGNMKHSGSSKSGGKSAEPSNNVPATGAGK